MFFINQNTLTPQNLRNIVVNLDNQSRLNPFENFMAHLLHTIEADPMFLNNNREISQILFSETFQIIYESIIFHQAKIEINSLGKICNVLRSRLQKWLNDFPRSNGDNFINIKRIRSRSSANIFNIL